MKNIRRVKQANCGKSIHKIAIVEKKLHMKHCGINCVKMIEKLNDKYFFGVK